MQETVSDEAGEDLFGVCFIDKVQLTKRAISDFQRAPNRWTSKSDHR